MVDSQSKRRAAHTQLSKTLSAFSNESLLKALNSWEARSHQGISGTSIIGEIDDTPIFVKKIPITDLELLKENQNKTHNLFNLPLCYQYGVGSLGFGAWRELMAHEITTNWVLSNSCQNFPLMYHWRILPDETSSINLEYWGSDDKYLDYWENNPFINKRLEGLRQGRKSIFVFLEQFPMNLANYLENTLKNESCDTNKVITLEKIFSSFEQATRFMKEQQFVHMDAHLANVLVKDDEVYISDFGLSISPKFNLSKKEIKFMEEHLDYDKLSSNCFLVHGVLSKYINDDNWDESLSSYIKDNSSVPDSINKVIASKINDAIKMNDFYRRLKEDKSTLYPLLMDYKITPITEHYIESFRQAVGSVAREKKYLAFLDAPSFEMSKSFVQSNIRDNWPHLVAIIDNKVIGWCDITSLNRPVFSHVGCMGIGVLKEYRGNGIGQQLLTQALSLASIKGLTRIELTVREDNKRAIAMYQKFGFVIEGVHQKSVLIDNKYYNQLFMALLFDEN